MAIFKSPVFQHLSGSVGNVTTYELDGKQVARAKTFDLKDRKSLAQLQQRERLKVVTRLKRCFQRVLPIGFCTSSGKVFSNRFVQENIHKVMVDDELNVTLALSALSLSGEGLALPLMEARIDEAGRRVVFRWKKQPLMPCMYKDDCLYGVVHEARLGRSREVLLGARGVNGELAWELPLKWDACRLVIYGFAVSADRRKASKTLALVES